MYSVAYRPETGQQLHQLRRIYAKELFTALWYIAKSTDRFVRNRLRTKRSVDF